MLWQYIKYNFTDNILYTGIRILSGLSVTIFGFISFVPNAMLSDDGNSESIFRANIGLYSSSLFIISGISLIFFRNSVTYSHTIIFTAFCMQTMALLSFRKTNQ